MNRFNLTDSPAALPGCCFICRSENRELYIDVNLSVDFEDNYPVYGAVYLCDECIREMVNHFGFITPDRAMQIQAENVELQRTLDGTLEKIEALKEALHALGNVSRVWDLTPVSGDSDFLQSAGEANTSESTGTKGSEDREPSEQVDDEGVAELRRS